MRTRLKGGPKASLCSVALLENNDQCESTDNPLSNVFSNSLLSLAHAKSNKARTVHMESIRIHAGDYSCHAHATLWVNGCVMDAHVFP